MTGRRDIMAEFRDYIDVEVHESKVHRIAIALGVSTRTLQSHCHKTFSISPKQFLLACRLHQARTSLMQPSEMTSVTGVATNHGFDQLGRFSGKYRDFFGETPSETLRRARA